MQLAARWMIAPLLTVTGAATLLTAVASRVETLRDPFLDDTETVEDEGDQPQITSDYHPITGAMLRDDEDACLPFLAGLTARPTWTLQAVDAVSGCMGITYLDRFEIHHDGLVVWKPPHLAERRLQLTAAQQARVRTLDTVSCKRTTPVGYGDRYHDVGLGIFDGATVVGQGAHLSIDSEAGAQLRAVLDEAIADFSRRRIEELGTVALDLAVVPMGEGWSPETAAYRLTLGHDRVLRTWHGKELLHADTVTPRELVDAVDWLVAQSTENVGAVRRDMKALGTLTLGQRTYPAGLRTWESYEWAAQGLLFREANAAELYEQKR